MYDVLAAQKRAQAADERSRKAKPAENARRESIEALLRAFDASTRYVYTLRVRRSLATTVVRMFVVTVDGHIADVTRQASRASGWRFDESAWGARVSHGGVNPEGLFVADTFRAVYDAHHADIGWSHGTL